MRSKCFNGARAVFPPGTYKKLTDIRYTAVVHLKQKGQRHRRRCYCVLIQVDTYTNVPAKTQRSLTPGNTVKYSYRESAELGHNVGSNLAIDAHDGQSQFALYREQQGKRQQKGHGQQPIRAKR